MNNSLSSGVSVTVSTDDLESKIDVEVKAPSRVSQNCFTESFQSIGILS